ncbi:hypothetical protein [Arthrobacter sp. TMS1-12-1]
MELSTIGWNQEARDKILLDADRALQEAVREAAETLEGKSRDEVYEFLFQKLQPQFVDFKPGPDLSACADAVASGDVSLDG